MHSINAKVVVEEASADIDANFVELFISSEVLRQRTYGTNLYSCLLFLKWRYRICYLCDAIGTHTELA